MLPTGLKHQDRQTNIKTNRQKNRQTDRKTDKHQHKQTDRQTNIKTDRQTDITTTKYVHSDGLYIKSNHHPDWWRLLWWLLYWSVRWHCWLMMNWVFPVYSTEVLWNLSFCIRRMENRLTNNTYKPSKLKQYPCLSIFSHQPLLGQ